MINNFDLSHGSTQMNPLDVPLIRRCEQIGVGDARGGAACAAAAYDDAPRVHDAGRRDGISPENRSQQKSPKRDSTTKKRATKVVGTESEGCAGNFCFPSFFLSIP